MDLDIPCGYLCRHVYHPLRLMVAEDPGDGVTVPYIGTHVREFIV